MYSIQLKTICLLFLGIQFSSSFATENDTYVVDTMNTEHNHLVTIAKNYLQFVHDVGQPSSVQQNDSRLKTLFAENLTKIDNRTVLFENNRDLLLPQMRGFEKDFNPNSQQADWAADFDTVIIIPSAETNSVVIHFAWTHINIGKATTMAILQCNSNNQIERIIDVWAKVQSN